MSRSRSSDVIRIRGARQHNLRSIDLDIPLGELIVLTGVSGSGKSSLAFATLFAEGQRRYVESFSAFARQFLERMDKPAADSIGGLPPAIAIDQTAKVRSARSTVGTMTELNDYLKVLFARAGTLHCETCDRPVERTTPQAAARAALGRGRGERALVTFRYPLDGVDRKEAHTTLARQGFTRVACTLPDQGLPTIGSVDDCPPDADGLHVVADRLRLDRRGRLVDALETALRLGRGQATIWIDGQAPEPVAEGLLCPHCNRPERDPQPSHFSFNSPLGACEACQGFGRTITVDLDRVIPDRSLSIADGCVRPWQTETYADGQDELLRFCKKNGIPTSVGWRDLRPEQQAMVVEESPGFYGIRGFFNWLERRAYRMHIRILLSRYRGYVPCAACDGARLKPFGLRVRVDGRPITEVWRMTTVEAARFFDELKLPAPKDQAVALVLQEIRARLHTLISVGLEYLTLDRASRTLSGGEVERVNLTAAIGSALTSTMYVLDEPSIGLHPRDNARLREMLLKLRDNGNTVILVEHDAELIRAADQVIDLGPGAGERGGKVVFQGSYDDLLRCDRSATGRHLAGDSPYSRREVRRLPSSSMWIRGARAHNLKSIDVHLPMGTLTCVTGVSGSGKSTLIEEILYRGLAVALGRRLDEPPGEHDRIEGVDLIDDVVLLDQAPVGRTPRGNPATYTKAWDAVRKLFGALPAARRRRLGAGAFSFNTPGGRCDSCDGQGFERVEMQFLADVFVTCEACGGSRFKPEVREVVYRGKSVIDILGMTVDETLKFFADRNAITRALAPLKEVGLGYLRLGQPVSTLSGGESQRLKLAGRLASRSNRRLLVVLDEPTTGLHFEDVRVLLRVLDRLIDDGHSVVVVEHNLDLIAHADHVIDLGPEGGDGGGQLVAEGPPEAIVAAGTWTGQALAPVLAGAARAFRGRAKRTARRRPRAPGTILVSGAREHNLKGLTATIPRDKLVVITGVSGSGKSTLAFDILYAEGQRRYLESLSAYARQYIRVLPRPDVEHVEGLPPTVAIEQRVSRPGANSTVATTTELWHYLRLLYARLGVPHCPSCDIAVQAASPDAIVEALIDRWRGEVVRLLAPMVVARKGLWKPILRRAARLGLRGVRVDGLVIEPPQSVELDRYREHDIEYVTARLRVTPGPALRDAVSAALALGDGSLMVLRGREAPSRFSTRQRCPRCGISFPDPDPRAFSFASRHGACESCTGSGIETRIDPDLLLDRARALVDGALLVYEAGPLARQRRRAPRSWADEVGGDPTTPLTAWPRTRRERLEEALTARMEELRESSSSAAVRDYLGGFAAARPCRKCDGTRLKAMSRAVRFRTLGIDEVAAMTVSEACAWSRSLELQGREATIGQPLVAAVAEKLTFLEEVGLGYLTLDRRAESLAGGEAQRLRLAAQLGSGLRGVCYVLDEPTIGLHARDSARLIGLLRRLRDQGNTVVVVEHDEAVVRAADWILDLGPGAGEHGGELVAAGTLETLRRNPRSRTGQTIDQQPHASELAPFQVRGRPRLRLRGVRHNNLRIPRIDFPLGALIAVSGVSGSGKSSLVHDVLYRALMRHHHRSAAAPGAHESLEGADLIVRIAEVDQTPIGKTPRSCPASYVGFLDHIRKLFASSPEARMRGYGPSRFSFNVKGGRCEACLGHGKTRVEMSFLPDVYVTCEECNGRRFNRETLEVEWNGRSIADVLELSVEQAATVFPAVTPIRRALEVLVETDLGYLRLGQPSPELSGGEAQRVKLAHELAKPSGGQTLYVLDEPTTGLHRSDVGRLAGALRRLVERGDTVVVVEHNLDVIARADWVIDLGPEGGAEGGRVVARGAPSTLAERAKTLTEIALRDHIDGIA